MAESSSDWFAASPPAPDADVLYVDVDGYEGPLDLLLDLARRQKVDLTQISVLALAEQYLAFIETVREKRIEIAADYLVMAAWLAYLKSRLMVPKTASDEEPSGEISGSYSWPALLIDGPRLRTVQRSGPSVRARQMSVLPRPPGRSDPK